jgi:hypothetical protein
MSFGLSCLCGIIDFLFLALLSQKEGTFSMFLFLRHPKPPRLRTARMETKARIRWKGPVQRRRLLLLFLKILSWTGRGNVSKKLLLPVPLPLRLWLGNPSRQRMVENSSTTWTRECSHVCLFVSLFLRDEEDPKRFAVEAPTADTLVVDEPPS